VPKRNFGTPDKCKNSGYDKTDIGKHIPVTRINGLFLHNRNRSGKDCVFEKSGFSDDSACGVYESADACIGRSYK